MKKLFIIVLLLTTTFLSNIYAQNSNNSLELTVQATLYSDLELTKVSDVNFGGIPNVDSDSYLNPNGASSNVGDASNLGEVTIEADQNSILVVTVTDATLKNSADATIAVTTEAFSSEANGLITSTNSGVITLTGVTSTDLIVGGKIAEASAYSNKASTGVYTSDANAGITVTVSYQ